MFILLALLTGLATPDQSPIIAIANRTLVVPIDAPQGNETEWLGLGLTLAMFAQQPNADVVSFRTTRELYQEQGYRIDDAVPLASKIKMAQDVRAEALVFGSIHDNHLELVRLHLPTQSVQRFEFRQIGSRSLDALAFEMADSVGIDGRALNVVDDFYRVLAACYLVEDGSVRRVFKALIERQTNNAFLIDEYEELYGDPIGEAATRADLEFWRDAYIEHDRLYRAYRASSAILELEQDAGLFYHHAKILFGLGNRDLACRYARMADALGQDIPPDDVCAPCFDRLSKSGDSSAPSR